MVCLFDGCWLVVIAGFGRIVWILLVLLLGVLVCCVVSLVI